MNEEKQCHKLENGQPLPASGRNIAEWHFFCCTKVGCGKTSCYLKAEGTVSKATMKPEEIF